MASVADFKFILSGGAANTDPAAALGGAISTASGGVVLSQSITASTIGGVTYDDAAGNGIGSGIVTYTNSGTTLQWTPPSGAIGPAVNIGSNGTYTVYGADGLGHVKVTVVAASLPGTDASQSPIVANQTNKVFDDIAVVESTGGDIEYRCVYVKNAHATDAMTGVKIWISADTPGADTLAIGLDAGGLNATAVTIANENTAPTGVSFSAPSSEGTALSMGSLAAGDYYALWVRRTVPSGTIVVTTADTSAIKARFV